MILKSISRQNMMNSQLINQLENLNYISKALLHKRILVNQS